MNTPASIFAYELKRRRRRKEIILFLALMVIFVFIANIGKRGYLESLKNKQVFQETEQRYVKSYVHYTQYGGYGIRLLFIPPPLSILYNDTVFEGLQANVNSGEKLSIYKNLKGRDFFVKKSDYMSLLGFSLLAAALFSVLYGCDLPRHPAYLRFLVNFTGAAKLFCAAAAARIIILLSAFLVLVLASLFWLRFYHIDLFQPPLLYIFLLTALVILFFFTAGLIIGTFRKKMTRTMALGVFYVVSFVLLPLALDLHTRVNTSYMESQFSLELKNLELIMNVEKRLYEKFGQSRDWEIASPELMKEIIKSLDREFKVLFERESAARALLLARIRARHYISAWYPVLFYTGGIEELSGCGGRSYLAFNRFSQVLKKKFIYFYVKKKFSENAGPGNVESFINHDENLFYTGSHLPYGFGAGIVLTLLYILAGLAIAYYRFKRMLKSSQGKQVTLNGSIDLQSPGATYIKTPDNIFVEYLCAALAGDRTPFPGTLRVDGKPAALKNKNEYTYTCCPDEIPGDIKVADLFHLLKGMIKPGREKVETLVAELKDTVWAKRFAGLDPDEKAMILFKFALLKQSPIIIFHELMDKCSPALTREMMTEISGLLAGGSQVIYISPFSYPNMYLNVDRYLVITRKGNEYESKKISG